MALIDPPRYVSVPPALIYGCEDLEREHYKALLMVVGWLWVTKRHGGDLTTTINELMERWGVAERTVYHRLQRFGELGYLGVRVQGGRCYLRLGARALGEAKGAETAPLQGEGGALRQAQGGASRLHGASSLHGINNTVGGGSGFDVDDLDQELPTTTINAELLKTLKLRGVHPRKAEALAADPWVT